MSYAVVLAYSFSRAVLVSLLALFVAGHIGRRINRCASVTRRRWWVIAALLPLFVPDLLVGFTYRLTATRLSHGAVATELLYAGLLVFRVAGLQVAVLLLLPTSAVSRSSVHSWKLIQQPTGLWWWQYLQLRLLGPWRPLAFGFLAGALLIFQEFETAALIQVDQHPVSLAVWLFDAHANGENLLVSLRYLAVALLMELAVLLPLFRLLPARSAGCQTHSMTVVGSGAKFSAVFALLFVVLGAVVLWFGPLVSDFRGVVAGLLGLVRQQALLNALQQIVLSVLPPLVAAVLALLAASILTELRRVWLVLAVGPGLCGSLFVSLLLLALFQLPGLHIFYDTSLPMIVGLFLFALPRAVVLIYVLQVLLPPTSRYSLRLLKQSSVAAVAGRAGRLWWRFVEGRWLLATAILSHWCFWDVSVVSNLRPVRFEPVVVRLYREMHWGRSELLLALATLAAVVPLLLFGLAAFLWRVRKFRSVWVRV